MLELPYEAQKTVTDLATDMLHQAFFDFHRMTPEEREGIDLDDLRQKIFDLPVDDTNAMRLSLDEQLRVLERSDVATEVVPESIEMDRLRFQIEMAVCQVLHSEAESIALEVLDELQAWLDNASLELSQVETTNRFGWAVHDREREEDDTTVYEYRNVEELNVDVWHFRHALLELFVCEYLEAE